MRFVVCVLLLLSSAAFGASPVDAWWVQKYDSKEELGPFGSPQLACSAWYASYDEAQKKLGRTTTDRGYDGRWCSAGNSSGGSSSAVPTKRGQTCPDGYKLNSSGQCVPDQPVGHCSAKAGTSEVVNITAAWQRTASTDTVNAQWLYPTKMPSKPQFNICSADGCSQTVDQNEDCAECGSWVSQTPAKSGLYRVSVDFRAHNNGSSCDASDSEIDQQAITPDDSKDPPCPGYVGEVNGVPGCYGTAQKPINSEPGKKPSNNETDKGNPAAGKKPNEGEGSGRDGNSRTPTNGTGGSAGGPGGAAGSGSKPNGTVNKPGDGKEQANCGAPGQPPCKIDESGTPKGDADKGKLKEASDKAHDETKKLIDKTKDLKADGWTFTFQFPTGCTPMPLPVFGTMVIDPCQYQSVMHDLMSMVWIAAAVWCCIGMVGATLRGE